jgi:hypothetical protein
VVLRNLPFTLCKPEGSSELYSVIDAAAAASGLKTRRLQPLIRKEDGLPTGVVFVLLGREGNGRIDGEGEGVESVVDALEGREVKGRVVRAARWVRPTGDTRGGGGGAGGGRRGQQQQEQLDLKDSE